MRISHFLGEKKDLILFVILNLTIDELDWLSSIVVEFVGLTIIFLSASENFIRIIGNLTSSSAWFSASVSEYSDLVHRTF